MAPPVGGRADIEPLVSVVVPVFNGARFLGECLESLLAQDYPAVEIIVVDDGSSDGSADLADGFAGIRVLRRPHEGLPRTRNAGIRAASGSLIGFCDADDTWKPEKARVQVDYLAAHPACGVVLCRQERSSNQGSAPRRGSFRTRSEVTSTGCRRRPGSFGARCSCASADSGPTWRWESS